MISGENDIASNSFVADGGEEYCVKELPNPRAYNKGEIFDDLITIIETYGSDATFCVANPFTSYWQQKIADTVVELINVWESPGIYIDQIGASSPALCDDLNHGHTLEGGTYWKDGYDSMMKAISKSSKVTISEIDMIRNPIVTEENAEVYMDVMQGFLVLSAFKQSVAQSSNNSLELFASNDKSFKYMVPAYPAVYGGYYISFGAEWFQTDFNDHDWWCGKLAAMFITGAQVKLYRYIC